MKKYEQVLKDDCAAPEGGTVVVDLLICCSSDLLSVFERDDERRCVVLRIPGIR
jgi:hypothetical protein